MTAVLKSVQLKDAPEPVDPIADLVQAIIQNLGQDVTRAGLAATPQRYAKALRYLAGGYSGDVESAVGNGVFPAEGESPVVVRDVQFYSLCEHHLLPFFGRAHIAYIPDGRILGLSKLPRIVDVFARRLQVQERLTSDIAAAIDTAVRPRGVGVVIEASHLCMMMRGVQKQNSMTITSALLGSFRDDARTRDEFLRLVHHRP